MLLCRTCGCVSLCAPSARCLFLSLRLFKCFFFFTRFCFGGVQQFVGNWGSTRIQMWYEFLEKRHKCVNTDFCYVVLPLDGPFVAGSVNEPGVRLILNCLIHWCCERKRKIFTSTLNEDTFYTYPTSPTYNINDYITWFLGQTQSC